MQVKKDGVVTSASKGNSAKDENVMIVSGRNVYDAFGRVAKAFYPNIDDFKIGDKHCIGNLKNLKDLTIANTNITSLSFAKELLQLKSLTILNCKKVQSFSDISFLRNLIRIEIRDVKNLHDINFLANSKNIEVVIIETDKLASIKSLASLKRIKALALFGKNFLIEDMDLTPIYNLELLSMLDIPNRKCYPVKINCYWNWDDYGSNNIVVFLTIQYYCLSLRHE